MNLPALAVALLVSAVSTLAFGQANKPSTAVTVVNDAASPVPVAVGSAVTVKNTAATPLFVTGVAGGGAAQSTTLAFSQTTTFLQPGTQATPPIDVHTCGAIRTGVMTEFNGDTFVVTLTNEQGMLLDQYVVGTQLGGTVTNSSRVYDVPGLSVTLALTPQNLPTGLPVTIAVWCR